MGSLPHVTIYITKWWNLLWMRSTACSQPAPLCHFWKRPVPVGNAVSASSVPDGALQYLLQTRRSPERRVESCLFPGTISHPIFHLHFQSYFTLHSHFPLREQAWATEEGLVWTCCDCSWFGERAKGQLKKEDQNQQCWPSQAHHLNSLR